MPLLLASRHHTSASIIIQFQASSVSNLCSVPVGIYLNNLQNFNFIMPSRVLDGHPEIVFCYIYAVLYMTLSSINFLRVLKDTCLDLFDAIIMYCMSVKYLKCAILSVLILKGTFTFCCLLLFQFIVN